MDPRDGRRLPGPVDVTEFDKDFKFQAPADFDVVDLSNVTG
ncbi:MAG: hypothetical protein ACR2K3_05795 [Nocardioides sp.]